MKAKTITIQDHAFKPRSININRITTSLRFVNKDASDLHVLQCWKKRISGGDVLVKGNIELKPSGVYFYNFKEQGDYVFR